MSVSAHKVGGPVGAGALAVRAPTDLAPHQYGGGQERERRSGTQDVVGAVGLAVALRLGHRRAVRGGAAGRRPAGPAGRGLAETVPGLSPHGAAGSGRPARAPPPVLRGIEREELARRSSTSGGVCASAGSSCASGALEPSHVLAAMGVPRRWRAAPSGSPSATTPPAPTSTGPWPSCRGPWRACARPLSRAERTAAWHTGRMRVLVAMSGGVDSSVAAALLVDQGHDVVGATLKLWGGPSDSGCCSVADVDDARRVAQQLGIDHHVFNLTEEFDAPRGGALRGGPRRRAGRPTPVSSATGPSSSTGCWTDRDRLGFDRAGHRPPRPGRIRGRRCRLRRGADADKDQSYVLSMLGQAELGRVVFPVGEMTKSDVRGARGPAGVAHGGQARQPGRLLHRSGEGRAGLPRRQARPPPRRRVDRRARRDGGRASRRSSW